MSRLVFCCLLLSVIFYQPLSADFYYGSVGARSSGCAGAVVAFYYDPEMLFYNPAGIGGEGLQVVAGYQNLFTGIQGGGLNLYHAAVVLPRLLKGNMAAGFTSFNLDQFRELSLYAAYSFNLQKRLFLGIAPRVLIWSAQGFAGRDPINNLIVKDKDFSSLDFSADAGLLYLLSDKKDGLISRLIGEGQLALALVLRDLWQPDISAAGNGKGRLPLTIESGISYYYQEFLFAVDYQLRGGFQDVKLGVEHTFRRLNTRYGTGELVIRSGVIPALSSSNSMAFSLGFSLRFKGYIFHYAFLTRPALAGLGATHSFSLQFQLKGMGE